MLKKNLNAWEVLAVLLFLVCVVGLSYQAYCLSETEAGWKRSAGYISELENTNAHCSEIVDRCCN